jgi:S-DNA-T family DNA segregation ATPase FtsK/SpoIIIE
MSSAVGTAGAVIAGLLALSGVTILTFDWHPFERLKTGRERAASGRRTALTAPPAQPPHPWEAKAPPSAPKVKKPRARRHVDEADADALSRLPDLDLLDPPNREAIDAGEAELERLGEVLVETLGTFRVEGKVVGRTTGPVVTQYEVAPAPGVKVGRIAALSDDLALAMRAQSIRIVAPIPGKAAVGVEVPNPVPRIVRLRELLEAPEWDSTRDTLPIVLGRDLEGRPVIADLAKMPHLLIAGATGSGKSVCINTIITSLIYRYTPRDLRMIMIDPKMVELSLYNALPHLRHPVVTNNKEAAQALKWVMLEMERRYELFHANGARNMEDFNRRVLDGRELVQPERETRNVKGERLGGGEDSAPRSAPSGPRPYTAGPLPFIIVIVDELADLMMTVQGEVEKPLAMLAQKARATGIHLLLATQRPSVNVITGLIKANFPSRIAFRVASKVDSRTILDQNGAETLLGNGDMLFLPPGKSEPIRIQGAYISTEESELVTGWYQEQRAAWVEEVAQAEEEDIIAVVQAMEAAEEGGAAPGDAGERDSLFREAAEVCISNQLGSTSLLQRKLRIGYGRAARIIDQLHEAGILGPPDGSRPREVLIDMGQLDQDCE